MNFNYTCRSPRPHPTVCPSEGAAQSGAPVAPCYLPVEQADLESNSLGSRLSDGHAWDAERYKVAKTVDQVLEKTRYLQVHPLCGRRR